MLVSTAIEVKGLRKSYGPVVAVDGIGLSVAEGEVFALLGPNGAGKTTTVEILEGFRGADGGSATVLGLDPGMGGRKLRQRIGIVLQSAGLDRYLTVAETIDLFGGYYPSPLPVDEVIELVGLTEKRAARVNTLSGGQQRRLEVGVALAGDPSLLFLDEPTTGFDPGARRRAWEVVRNLASIGKTIFLTTHYMEEAQALAGRVAIIARGRILAEGPPASLGGRDLDEAVIRFRAPGVNDLPHPAEAKVSVRDGLVEIRTPDPTRLLHDITGWALARGEVLDGLEVVRPTLEDVYLRLTGDETQEPGA